ncbi:DNA-directed RNA polymerases I II and III subunit RPABC4 [Crotalus adamanteus]
MLKPLMGGARELSNPPPVKVGEESTGRGGEDGDERGASETGKPRERHPRDLQERADRKSLSLLSRLRLGQLKEGAAGCPPPRREARRSPGARASRFSKRAEEERVRPCSCPRLVEQKRRRSFDYVINVRHRVGRIKPRPNMETEEDAPPPKQQPMIYICGDCHKENEIKARDPIRCRECGYRIMYKKRTKRLVVFDAR